MIIKITLKHTIIPVAMTVLLAACGGDSEKAAIIESNQGEAVTVNSVKDVSSAKLWRGPARGYEHSSLTDSDRIELFIQFGRLLGAASVYNRQAGGMLSLKSSDVETVKAGQLYLASIFDESLLASYAKVDPMVQAKAEQTNTPLDIQSTLIGLNEKQQIVDISNGDRSRRDQQYAANQKVHLVSSRIRDAVLAFFPSRQEYLLASSALMRKAGDKVAVAVSANGTVLNSDLLWEAYALIDRSIKLDPGDVSYCNAQREAIRVHKKAIDDLLNKMVPNQLGQGLELTASDVYQLAEQAYVSAKRLPAKGSKECS